jgi:uncharacterized protein (DUF1330 family)
MGRATFSDVSLIKKYIESPANNVANFPAKLLSRDAKVLELEGGIHFEHYYLWEFADLRTAYDFWKTPQYQEAAKFRRAGCSAVELVLFDGGDWYTGRY